MSGRKVSIYLTPNQDVLTEIKNYFVSIITEDLDVSDKIITFVAN